MAAIAPGTRLGPYEITTLAGAGGMGEVYKARDTRLDRTVAIKVLPREVATDVVRRSRFENEARVIASLSHPHICALHDVGTEPPKPTTGEPIVYLVMEYLDGATLTSRLERGALPLAQTVLHGRDIAAALAAAHRQGVIHRDLKPANVMLTRSGLKLLDFGLAKAAEPSPVDARDESLTTMTGMTLPGMVMGTLPYMSPEQIEGRPVDHRADIFALGAVIYEMATGRRAFPGESPGSLTSAILTKDPPPIEASPALDRIVRGCLEKDPDDRWQSAHDVARQLSALAGRHEDAASREAGWRRWVPWAIAAAAVLLAVAVLLQPARPTAERTAGGVGLPGAVSFQIPPPDRGRFVQNVEFISFAASPDGTRVAFSAADDQGVRLWVRALADLHARPLDGTQNATSVFWSPDGRSLAFFSDGRLQRINLHGGGPITICRVRAGIGQTGTWGADDRILFASIQGEALFAVPATGGTPTELIRPDRARGELRVAFPTFLPDGRRFLYEVTYPEEVGAVMLAGAGGSPVELVRSKTNAAYIDSGYLLFAQDSTLVAQKFDPSTARPSGELIAIANPVNRFLSTGISHFSASHTGVIVFQPHLDRNRIAWFDRAGRELATVLSSSHHQSIRLSRNGQEITFARENPRLTTPDLWTLDLDRGTESKLTNHPGSEVSPLFTSDGWLIFASTRRGAPRLTRRNLASGIEEELQAEAPGLQLASDVSADGQWLLYGQRSPDGTLDIMLRNLRDGRVQPYVASAADEGDARLSPDGRFTAWSSNESGRSEIYIAGFPSPGTPRLVSAGGGYVPRWSRDGRELFYMSPQGLMAVPIGNAGGTLDIGKATRLFGPIRWREFEVAGDGRLLGVVPEQAAAERPLTVIVNWAPRGSS